MNTDHLDLSKSYNAAIDYKDQWQQETIEHGPLWDSYAIYGSIGTTIRFDKDQYGARNH